MFLPTLVELGFEALHQFSILSFMKSNKHIAESQTDFGLKTPTFNDIIDMLKIMLDYINRDASYRDINVLHY